ncbi:efflux RND transporter periplasmic adaptor subunit [Stakelama tenebrarum]|uniref:Efflux RND transporter periplasmic adaptor subunit n=1 Tax=Stakelama tenebrarum TaxID=2711215 RepID=A0A6G6Y4I7_9SPHN|nr:efflux RND transporter periplasmic adaptor subunit [Sphingosinithalassobacter tenebrarum]QIG79864.1 efflux RND transporter periplasmic adaptor subunit [Sphingosinithalassobacter tenebrarum]
MKKFALFAGFALLLAGCGQSQDAQQGGGPPKVFYETVSTQDVTLDTRLPGRTSAYESSEVRPQVNGIIKARLFQEGDMVGRGQPLYRIDSAPYAAQVASARAALARARASIESTEALARRYGELVEINAISRQEYDNAVAAANQAKADVAAQRAALESAQIDLARTTIRAPISGRIGRSTFTTGALVTASQQNPLTTIQRLDPIYVDIQQSSADILRLRRQLMAGDLIREDGAARVRLILEDGSTYPIEGSLKFTDVTVDPDTGSQVIRAVFANPEGLLLPGMFVRAQIVEGTRANAMLVSQRAVSRDAKGNATVLVVDGDGKLQPRQITATRTVGQDWIVESGLKPGDKVIVQGAQNLRPGTPVDAAPYEENGSPQGGTPQANSAQPAQTPAEKAE